MRVGVDSDSLWKLLFFLCFFLFLKSFFVCASVSLGKRKFRFSKVKTEHSLPIPLFSAWVSKSNSFPFPPDFYREEVCACLTASKSLCNPTSSYKQGAVKHKSDWAMMNVKGEVTIFFFLRQSNSKIQKRKRTQRSCRRENKVQTKCKDKAWTGRKCFFFFFRSTRKWSQNCRVLLCG